MSGGHHCTTNLSVVLILDRQPSSVGDVWSFEESDDVDEVSQWVECRLKEEEEAEGGATSTRAQAVCIVL